MGSRGAGGAFYRPERTALECGSRQGAAGRARPGLPELESRLNRRKGTGMTRGPRVSASAGSGELLAGLARERAGRGSWSGPRFGLRGRKEKEKGNGLDWRIGPKAGFFFQTHSNKFKLNSNSRNLNSKRTTNILNNARQHGCTTNKTSSFYFIKTTNHYLFLPNSL